MSYEILVLADMIDVFKALPENAKRACLFKEES